MVRFICSACLVVFLALGVHGANAPAPATYAENQKVEIREGDTWSAATIVRKEGRRYLIKYEGADATEEWVTADRIRLPGDASPAAANGGEQPQKVTGLDQARAPAWQVGQKVEVKWGGMWSAATITNKRGEWYLVTYTERGGNREWVEPWRIRAVGSKEDKIGHASPNPAIMPGRPVPPPPSQTPGPAPRPFGAAGDAQQAEEDKALASDPAYRAADASSARPVLIDPGVGKPPLDPAPKAVAKPASRAIALKGATGQFFDSPTAILFPRGLSNQVMVAHVDSAPGKRAAGRLERVDLAAGRSLAVYTFEPELTPLDVSPDGKQALLRTTRSGAGKNDRIEIWSLEGAKAQRKCILVPYGDQEWHGRNVEAGLFIDAAHVLTVSAKGSMDLWNIETGKAEWTCSAGAGARPFFTPGGKQVVFLSDRNAVFMDPAAGSVVGAVPVDAAAGSVAVSPSGRQLAAFRGGDVAVYDLSTGSLTGQFALRVIGRQTAMPAEGFVLLDGSILIDLERRIPLWKYGMTQGATAVSPDGAFWYVRKADRPVLACYDVPHAEATSLARTLKAEDLLLLKPGVKVALINNVSADDQQRKAISDALVAQIKSLGLVADDAAAIRITASIEPGKSEERTYRAFGEPAFASGTKVTVTPQISKVTIESEGKTVWESRAVASAGFMLLMKEGQTIEQAVAEATKPNLKFYDTVKLPVYVTRPRDPEWYGESQLP